MSGGPAGAPQRRIPFERASNFRDLGGYRTRDGRSVRWRMLFRADSPHLFTPRDQTRFRDELRIVTVIDLREPASVERGSVEFLDGETRHHVPFLDDEALRLYRDQGSVASAEWYLEILRGAGRIGGVARIFELLADPDSYPAMFHCSLGKDRAGVLAALVLSVLGVDDEQVLDDYALSERYMGPIRERIRNRLEALADAGLAEAGGDGRLRMPPDGTFRAPREWMGGALDRVRAEHGSVRAYVEAQGVERAMLDRMSALLLE